MEIKNSFVIEAPIDEAWALLTDIPGIARCLPGAKLTGEDNGVYNGAVQIKAGPVTAEYRGTAEIIERDDHNHRVVIDGQGRDSRNTENSQSLVTASMTALDGRTQVDISTDVQVTGKVSQFGRGVMEDVSEKLVKQFADCLAIKLEGSSALEAIASAGATEKANAAGSDAAAAGLDSPELDSTDDEGFDLIQVAGGPVFKRALPVTALAVLIVIVLLIVV